VPLYEYQCTKCGYRFERIQKFSDPLVTECPDCNGRVEQLISTPAVHFKGSGWYVTDYAKKNSSAGSSTNGRKDDGTTAKSESKVEAKSETKSDKPAEKK